MARAVGYASAAVLTLSCALLGATDPDRDFSGTWILEPNQVLMISQRDAAIDCSLGSNGAAPVAWFYNLNGTETRYRIGDENRNSVVKWEGSALLINTLVSGSGDYTEMDRWRLSPDRNVLTVNRQIVTAGGTNESVLVYRRQGYAPTATPPPTPVARGPVAEPQQQQLRREPPAEPSEFVVAAGTHIPLSLRNSVDTKHSHEGDHIYLETTAPISVSGRIIIPRGSYVNGTVISTKPAGAIKGKGELQIRFDGLILPNGTSRDFRARLASADARAKGQVDQEGKITGERDTPAEVRGTAEGGAIGAGVGSVAGAASGHVMRGVGIGAGIGAVAGLATARVSHRPDASLPQGTMVDMLLDRDLHFTPAELNWR